MRPKDRGHTGGRQALLPKKTLRRKVSLGKNVVLGEQTLCPGKQTNRGGTLGFIHKSENGEYLKSIADGTNGNRLEAYPTLRRRGDGFTA